MHKPGPSSRPLARVQDWAISALLAVYDFIQRRPLEGRTVLSLYHGAEQRRHVLADMLAIFGIQGFHRD